MRLELTDSDLGDIWVFLARNSETQADLVIAQILECARALETTPLMGKDFSHLRRGLRRFICGQYLVPCLWRFCGRSSCRTWQT